jgi:hypothetical protein
MRNGAILQNKKQTVGCLTLQIARIKLIQEVGKGKKMAIVKITEILHQYVNEIKIK